MILFFFFFLINIQHDLNQTPWPFKDDQFDHIVFNHSISHLDDFIKIVEEAHRISKKDGIIEILAPHYASDNSNTDPTIKVRVGIRTMNYFCDEYDFKYLFYSSVRFKMLKRHISFRQNKTDFRFKLKPNPLKWVGLEFLINQFPRLYERFFVYILQPSEVYFKLKVLK